MQIIEAAKASGLSVKTVRYYADIGLIIPGRSSNGYRDFCEDDLRMLVLIGRARGAGFSVDECREILAFAEHNERSASRDSIRIKEFLARIEQRIIEIKALRETLMRLSTGSTARQ